MRVTDRIDNKEERKIREETRGRKRERGVHGGSREREKPFNWN